MSKIIGGLVGLIIVLCLIEKFVFGDDKNDEGLIK